MNHEALKALKSDDRLKLKSLYDQYRSEFIGFGKKYDLDEDSLADVYQEAFLALRKRAMKGKLDNVNSSMKTYLFAIGKYKCFDTLKEKGRSVTYESHLHMAGETFPDIEIDETPSLSKEQLLLRKHFKELGKKCQQVLTLFYYRGLSINEIVEQTDYQNENVVKAHKSRCLKTLRESINR